MEDRYINFYHFVMECIDNEDLPPDNEICSCEDLCKSCVIPHEFDVVGCPYYLAIDSIGYDDKGNYITASCKSYKGAENV